MAQSNDENSWHAYSSGRPTAKNKFPVQPGSQMAAESFVKLGFPCDDKDFLYYDRRTRRKEQDTQTQFREEDIQTCPWNPPYSLFPQPDSELLFLKNFHYDDDLPAGEVQLDSLKAFRSRQKWEEAYLPPGEEDKTKYYLILESREREKFQTRNQEIESIQADYLERFVDEFNRRRRYVQQINQIRLNHLWKLKVQEKQKMQYNMAVKTAHVIHGFEHRRNKLYPLHKRRDIIAEYSDFSSQVYCSSKIGGKVSSHISNYTDFSNSKYLTTYEGLLQIEPYLSDIGKGEWGPPKRHSLSERRYLRFLQNIQDDFRLTKITSMKEATKRKKAVIQERFRPFTPTAPLTDVAEVKKNIASIILKRLVRGRVAQYLMIQEREANRDLINELQSTHFICKAEEEKMISKINSIKEAINKEAKNHEIDCLGSEFFVQMTGESLLDIIVFLARSQLRHREEYLAIKELHSTLSQFAAGSFGGTLHAEVPPPSPTLSHPPSPPPPAESQVEGEKPPSEKQISEAVEPEKKKVEKETLPFIPVTKEKETKEGPLKEAQKTSSVTGVLMYLSPEQLDIINLYRKQGACVKKRKSLIKKKTP